MRLYPPLCEGLLLAATLGIAAALVAAAIQVEAAPSSQMYKKDGDVYDEWGVCRTRGYGEDGFFQAGRAGFRPIIAFESLGGDAELAYQMGREFAQRYSDPQRLATAIFEYVRNHVRYTSDMDQFGYKDFAQNADELARGITGTGARGDCEDYAVLLAVMWKAAGLRSAIVLAPRHAAALVYLPGFRGGNMDWKLNGEKGWIWGEATGANNPLGWTPDRFLGEDLVAYEVSDVSIDDMKLGRVPLGSSKILQPKGGGAFIGISPFFSLIFFMWILSALSRALRGIA